MMLQLVQELSFKEEKGKVRGRRVGRKNGGKSEDDDGVELGKVEDEEKQM